MGVKKKNGFSLIELIISIAILVILTGLLAPQFMKYIEKARQAKMIQKLDSIEQALEVAVIEAVESGANSNTSGIIITKGKTPNDEADKKEPNINIIDDAVCKSLIDLLGENEVKNMSIIIFFDQGMKSEDIYSFKNVFIQYYIAPESKDYYENYYYYVKGVYDAPTHPGTYGIVRDGVPTQWK